MQHSNVLVLTRACTDSVSQTAQNEINKSSSNLLGGKARLLGSLISDSSKYSWEQFINHAFITGHSYSGNQAAY